MDLKEQMPSFAQWEFISDVKQRRFAYDKDTESLVVNKNKSRAFPSKMFI